MNQQYQQFDPKTIETLKAARNQVMKAESSEHSRGADLAPEQVPASRGSSTDVGTRYGAGKGRNTDGDVNRGRDSNPRQAQFVARNKFAEEFVQKLAFIEQETAAVDEEMAKVEKLWSSLVEKKQQLEARRSGFVKVKDKLKELDKEMSDVLKSQSFDKLRIDPEQRRMGQQI